jgi:hypothetical protein
LDRGGKRSATPLSVWQTDGAKAVSSLRFATAVQIFVVSERTDTIVVRIDGSFGPTPSGWKQSAPDSCSLVSIRRSEKFFIPISEFGFS